MGTCWPLENHLAPSTTSGLLPFRCPPFSAPVGVLGCGSLGRGTRCSGRERGGRSTPAQPWGLGSGGTEEGKDLVRKTPGLTVRLGRCGKRLEGRASEAKQRTFMNEATTWRESLPFHPKTRQNLLGAGGKETVSICYDQGGNERGHQTGRTQTRPT